MTRIGSLLTSGIALIMSVSYSHDRALAQGLFDFLFGEYPGSQYGYDRVPTRIKISGPRYYSYKPDRMSFRSFKKLAKTLPIDGPPSERETAFVQAQEHIAKLKVRTLAPVADAITKYYGEAPDFIWTTSDGKNSKARAVLEVLESADVFGLDPASYRLITLQESSDPETLKDRAAFEIELSARVLEYALDATRGRVDPNRISGYHDLKRKVIDLPQLLQSLRQSEDVGAILTALHPQNQSFKALVGELKKLRTEAEEPEIEIDRGMFLRPGGTSEEIPNIVAAIKKQGSDELKTRHADTLSEYQAETEYRPELVDLVKDYQRENNLKVDGVIGPNTVAAMVPMTRNEKMRKLNLALERMRWLPSELGSRHVLINQSSFRATYFEQGKPPLTMRVVVGKKSNQTNFFTDEIERVEYNPYWGVPLSIIVNEMMPKLSRDPSYLDRLGYEVTTASGRHVSSYDVDWYAVATKRASINVRQPPGERNALGAVKILFPNKHAIYMHDTPQKHLFQQDRRAFSHGCVRLHRPREMAAAVLGKSIEHVNQRIAAGANEQEELRKKIPVYVAYFTAWRDPETGDVRYSQDIYDRDRYLSKAIRRTQAERTASD